MGVDPSVSPADTIRRARGLSTERFKRERVRDKAALAGLEAIVELNAALIDARECDKQHIEQLTEVGKAAQLVADLNGEGRSTYGRHVSHAEFHAALFALEMAVSGARAVLADKEDAALCPHGHADWHQCHDCYNATGEGVA